MAIDGSARLLSRMIGKSLVGVVQHLDETKNKAIFIHVTVVTLENANWHI